MNQSGILENLKKKIDPSFTCIECIYFDKGFILKFFLIFWFYKLNIILQKKYFYFPNTFLFRFAICISFKIKTDEIRQKHNDYQDIL